MFFLTNDSSHRSKHEAWVLLRNVRIFIVSCHMKSFWWASWLLYTFCFLRNWNL